MSQVLGFGRQAIVKQVAYHAGIQPKLGRTSNKVDLLSSLLKLDFVSCFVAKMVTKVAIKVQAKVVPKQATKS